MAGFPRKLIYHGVALASTSSSATVFTRQQLVETLYCFTIWLFNIATGNDPFIDGLPIKNGDFPWLC